MRTLGQCVPMMIRLMSEAVRPLSTVLSLPSAFVARTHDEPTNGEMVVAF